MSPELALQPIKRSKREIGSDSFHSESESGLALQPTNQPGKYATPSPSTIKARRWWFRPLLRRVFNVCLPPFSLVAVACHCFGTNVAGKWLAVQTLPVIHTVTTSSLFESKNRDRILNQRASPFLVFVRTSSQTIPCDAR